MSAIKLESALAGFGTITGTPKEVRELLLGKGNERVIAFTFKQGSQREAETLADTVIRIAPLLGPIIARRRQEEMASIVEALVPSVEIPQHMMLEAKMAAEARSAVFATGDWLTAAQIAELAGFSSSNPSAQPNKWKKDGQIFAVRHKGIDYYPGFALDAGENYRPFKALKDVIQLFGERKSAWGLAYWFASANSFLDGKRPQDLLANEAAQVLAAAQDEMLEVAHG